MLCCSPHLFSVVTLLQENKVPFNCACTCESVPLTAAVMLMIKTHRLNKTIQIHNAYVSVITCVRSVRKAFGRYTTVKASTPLVDGLVNYALWHCRPRFNQSLLQLRNRMTVRRTIVQFCLSFQCPSLLQRLVLFIIDKKLYPFYQELYKPTL